MCIVKDSIAETSAFLQNKQKMRVVWDNAQCMQLEYTIEFTWTVDWAEMLIVTCTLWWRLILTDRYTPTVGIFYASPPKDIMLNNYIQNWPEIYIFFYRFMNREDKKKQWR